MLPLLGCVPSHSIIIQISVDCKLDSCTHVIIRSTGDVVIVVGGRLNAPKGIDNLLRNKPSFFLLVSYQRLSQQVDETDEGLL